MKSIFFFCVFANNSQKQQKMFWCFLNVRLIPIEGNNTLRVGDGGYVLDNVLKCHLDAFMFHKNIGKNMSAVMTAFYFLNGKRYTARHI